jgi:hypothetical protein
MPYDLAIQQLPRAHLISIGFNQRTIECDTFQYMIKGIVSLETYCHELAIDYTTYQLTVHLLTICVDYIRPSATQALVFGS